MEVLRVACRAMATRFEIVLEGESRVRLRAAGEEALAEIERLERQLSFYRRTSAVGRINAEAAARPVRVEAEVFELLQRAAELHLLSGGAFDVTVGPLMRCWSFARGPGGLPDPAALEEARKRVGMDLVELDADRRTVRFARPGVLLDLGAIGKGYAITRAAATLRELGIDSALLHGGTSTAYGIGRPRERGAWRVAIEYPGADDADVADRVVAVVELENRALSVSAISGKSFEAGGEVYGHVLDPRSGWPVQGATLAAVVTPSATEADALSTALLTLGLEEHSVVTSARADLSALILGGGADGAAYEAAGRGIAIRPSPRLARTVPF